MYIGTLLVVLLLMLGPVIAIVVAVVYLARRGRPGHVALGLSADGKSFWDGQRWRSAISEDGKWRWDGKEWKSMQTEVQELPPPG
jgi:cytosine/uracil/thiamine/allantoin permease